MKKLISLLVWTLLIVNSSQAQTPNQTQIWQVYTVKDEAFSVALPAPPAMDTSNELRRRPLKDRRTRLLGSYADGVVYTIEVLENPEPQQSLEEFIKGKITLARMWDLSTQRDLIVDGITGKEISSFDRANGSVQFFATKDRLYEFTAFGVPADDPRISKFFSSLSLRKLKESIVVTDGPGRPLELAVQAGSSDDTANNKPLTGKEVERKIRLGMKPQPSYTESARQNAITGTVVLRCVFASDGTVTNIRVLSGLPDGLTERAIDAATKIKFIPAMKDGHYVSMWMQLEYNFNLY